MEAFRLTEEDGRVTQAGTEVWETTWPRGLRRQGQGGAYRYQPDRYHRGSATHVRGTAGACEIQANLTGTGDLQGFGGVSLRWAGGPDPSQHAGMGGGERRGALATGTG